MKFSLAATLAALAVTATAVSVGSSEDGPRAVLGRSSEGRLDRRWCYPLCCHSDGSCTGAALCDATVDTAFYTSYCCQENLGNVSPVARCLES